MELKLVQDDFKQEFGKYLLGHLSSQGVDSDLIRLIGAHEAGRIRPQLFVLSSMYYDPHAEPNMLLAAALELMHTASLIHDDILDDSSSRRGASTLHVQLGTPKALILGNIAYSQALKIIAETRNWSVVDLFNEALEKMLEAEREQGGNKAFNEVHQEMLLDVIKKKTAALFDLCFKVPRAMSQVTNVNEDELEDFFGAFGVYYQLVDDILDCRRAFSDIQEGNITIPTFYAWTASPAEDKHRLQRMFSRLEVVDCNYLMQLFERTKALEKAEHLADYYCESAIRSIQGISQKNGQVAGFMDVLDKIRQRLVA